MAELTHEGLATAINESLDAREARQREKAEKAEYDRWKASGHRAGPSSRNDWTLLGIIIVALIIALALIYAATRNSGVTTVGAPLVGSVLPKGMVPGNWYATGKTVVVPTGTRVDTSPRECVRDGVRGQCALRKRGS